MLDAVQMSLCDTQGQLFELSGRYGYAGEPFIRSFRGNECGVFSVSFPQSGNGC